MKKHLKAAAGFTLVELIVVIAILGILAGVAVPVYSGYVKKANMAADQTLVDSINTAFAAACIEHGYDVNDSTQVNAGNAQLTIDGTTKQLDYGASNLVNEEVKTSFAAYLGTNNGFKAYTALKFVNGLFVNADGSAYANLTFAQELIEKVKLSNFFTAEGLGVNNLMNKVNYVTNLAADLATMNPGSGAEQMLQAYNMKMFEDLGIDPDSLAGLEGEELEAAMAPLYQMVDEKVAALDAQGNVAGWNTMTDEQKSQYAQNVILGNYAVLDAAKGMKNQDPADVLNTIKTTSNFKDLILNTSNEGGVAQASAAYGLYTAYAYSISDPTERAAAIDRANNPVELLKAMDDPGFRGYLETDKAETDLAGYMAAMEMIDASASDEDAVYNLMINGFTDPALLALINQQMK